MSSSTIAVAVLCGNSDDRLTQREWSNYVTEVAFTVKRVAETVHFEGAPAGGSPWQNFCMVAEIDEAQQEPLIAAMSEIAKRWRQESIAVVIGETWHARAEDAK